MQSPKDECLECDRLWREFGTVTRDYIALTAANPASIADILMARNERMRVVEEIRAHERAAHGGERLISWAV